MLGRVAELEVQATIVDCGQLTARYELRDDGQFWYTSLARRRPPLDKTQASNAIVFLRGKLEPLLLELELRILEQPKGEWISGRKVAKCWMCQGECTLRRLKPEIVDKLPAITTAEDLKKVYPEDHYLPPERCPICKGHGEAHEMPLHHGWGTSLRNMLRGGGFGEKELRIENLDDYYVNLVEMAVLVCACTCHGIILLGPEPHPRLESCCEGQCPKCDRRFRKGLEGHVALCRGY